MDILHKSQYISIIRVIVTHSSGVDVWCDLQVNLADSRIRMCQIIVEVAYYNFSIENVGTWRSQGMLPLRTYQELSVIIHRTSEHPEAHPSCAYGKPKLRQPSYKMSSPVLRWLCTTGVVKAETTLVTK